MTAIAERFTPGLAQLGALGAFFVIVFALVLLGACLGGRRSGRTEGDLLFGWAAVSILFTLVGAATSVPFTYVTWALLAGAVAAGVYLLRRDGRVCDGAELRILLLSAPLILLVGNMTASQWDEFTQWLPNARFLLEYDTFPRQELPKSPSVFPAYPHGLALIIYMTSRLAGRLVENAGALFNLVLLLSFGLLIVRLIRDALQVPKADRLSWGYCALAALSVTMLSPTFVPKVVFTAYADTGTAVALGFCAVFAWQALNALARDDLAEARALAWQVGLAATALLNVKQVNLVLFAILLAAAFLAAWRDPQIAMRRAFALLPRIVILPLVVYAAWRLHVNFNIAAGEFSFQPISKWMIALIPDVLARMALIASKKSGYFGVMTVAIFFAARALWRPRGSFDRLAIIAGAMFVLYNGFLLFTYVTAFGEYDARRAASYWRYNMHLGAVCLAFAAYGIALLWQRHLTQRLGPRVRGALFKSVIVLAVVLPVALSHKIRFDADRDYIAVRAIGNDLAEALKPGDRVLLVDANDSGQYLIIVRFLLYGSAQTVGEITSYQNNTADGLRRAAAKRRASHVWIRLPTPATEDAFGIQMKPDMSYLLERKGRGWTKVRSWAYGAATRRTH